MFICPNCNHEEPPGALFCSDCGAKLVYEKGQDGETTKVVPKQPTFDKSPGVPRGEHTVPLGNGPLQGTAKVTLYLLEVDQKLPLENRDEFTLGRVSEGQPLIPEIDLSAYDAYEQGVSRLHAVIGILENKVIITDLGSANGTWVNGERITPHLAKSIHNGDLVTLGKLKMQALIR